MLLLLLPLLFHSPRWPWARALSVATQSEYMGVKSLRFSRDHCYLAYMLDTQGDEVYSVRIKPMRSAPVLAQPGSTQGGWAGPAR